MNNRTNTVKRIAAIAIGAALLSGAGVAHANNITATISPWATATTAANGATLRARVTVRDTAADERAARAEFRRNGGAILSITANGGNGSSATSANGVTISDLRVGAVNNNPLHANSWSGWSSAR